MGSNETQKLQRVESAECRVESASVELEVNEERRKGEGNEERRKGGREKAPTQGRDGGVLFWKIFITVG
ncbi:hypothetical protein DVH24_038907 [Malus domestica]|uniref:Uncharacterized protein n=1 Tax=Malus domestica TaxID=3750 RepID=A0A498KGM7_MALDO|nr:hypothetical protein DVH24_038907 [Malus domestica]